MITITINRDENVLIYDFAEKAMEVWLLLRNNDAGIDDKDTFRLWQDIG